MISSKNGGCGTSQGPTIFFFRKKSVDLNPVTLSHIFTLLACLTTSDSRHSWVGSCNNFLKTQIGAVSWAEPEYSRIVIFATEVRFWLSSLTIVSYVSEESMRDYYWPVSLYDYLSMLEIILERSFYTILCRRGHNRSGRVCEEARIVHSVFANTPPLLHVHCTQPE